MNEKDKALVSLLKQNARMSVSDLARKLGVSRTTVQQRLGRLEQNGDIAGYTVRLGDAVRESQLQAHVNLVVKPNAGKQIVAAMGKIPAIETLYTVSGKIDLIAIINVSSPADLDSTLDQISTIPGIQSTETAIVLTTKFDRR
jgi:DNA-binding Lrp family transcriptional regulator